MIKITEQGEVLSYKYAVPQSASYELELAVSGLIKASQHLVVGDSVCTNNFEEIMSQMSVTGEKKYRDLTDDKEGIMDYFYEATPVQELAELNIGSRPSHRKRHKDPSIQLEQYHGCLVGHCPDIHFLRGMGWEQL